MTPEQKQTWLALVELCRSNLGSINVAGQRRRAAILAMDAEVRRLQVGLSAIEARWHAASKDSVFTRHYRDVMNECASELAVLLAGNDDAEIQAEIDKAFKTGQL